MINRQTLTCAVLLAAGLSLGWLANGWRIGEQMAEQRTEHTDLLRRTAEANAQVILQQQVEQQSQAQRLAELDNKHTKELSDALEENRRLEDLYSTADGERSGLHIDVIVARNDAIVSETVGAGSVGDAASRELSGAAGRAAWNPRRSMDWAKLEYLQGWIGGQSLQPPEE